MVNQLCVLFNPDCAIGTDAGTTTPDSDDIPEDFPLAVGWPDRLGAAWTDVEDYRYRQLLTFEDADGAIAYQRQLVEAYRQCPRTEDGEGSASLTDVRQTSVGGESWAVLRTFEYLDAPR